LRIHCPYTCQQEAVTPVTADVRKMGARESVFMLRAHSSTSSTVRTRKGFLRTPGFFRIVVRVYKAAVQSHECANTATSGEYHCRCAEHVCSIVQLQLASLPEQNVGSTKEYGILMFFYGNLQLTCTVCLRMCSGAMSTLVMMKKTGTCVWEACMTQHRELLTYFTLL
jgi:hypothetical protein